MKKRKLAVVISHPTQHFVPLYAALSEYSDLELKVFYIAENGVKVYRDEQFGVDVQWDTPMLRGYEYEFVEPNKVLDDFGFFSVDSKRLSSRLEQFNADWLWVHGYAQRANWRAVRSKKANTRVLYSSDSNAHDIKTGSHVTVRQRLKEKVKQAVIKKFFNFIDYYMTISPANERYLLHYGAKQQQLVKSVFPVDIERLCKQKESLSNEELLIVRKTNNIPEDSKVLLVIGKLIPRKRVGDVVKALSQLSDTSVHLLIVGSGECHDDLIKQSLELKISERVHITGFVNQGKLPAYFSTSDVLVFPSENEPYGAVVAESLPFALPVMIASRIGAIGASAIEGENAVVFNVGDVNDLVCKLNDLFANKEKFLSFSKHSRMMALQHDKRVMAEDIHRICTR